MNVFTVAGRLTKDGELRFTSSGTPVLGFTVATDVGYGEKKHALFVRCSLWGKRAESLDPYLKKGMPITVYGEADLREWEANGKSGTSLELRVNEVELQGSRSQSTDNRSEPDNRQQAAPQQGGFDDPDIPF